MAFSRTAYLLAYNVGMAAGWSYALYLGVKGALDTELPSSLAGCMPSGGSVVGMYSHPCSGRRNGPRIRCRGGRARPILLLTRNSTRSTTFVQRSFS